MRGVKARLARASRRRRVWGDERTTHLCKVEVPLLLEALQVRRHLRELRAQRLDGLVRLCRRRAVAADGGLPAGAGAADPEPAGAGRGRERRNRRGRVRRRALAPRDGVVALPAVVRVPEALDPLQELEVIPNSKRG